MGQQRPREAEERVKRILQEQPGYRQAEALREELQHQDAARTTLRPRLVDALRQPVTLNFKVQPIASIFDAISRLAGIDFVFDPEVAIATPASIIASDTTAEDAINLLLRTHQLDKKVLSQNSMLIYPARAEKPGNTRNWSPAPSTWPRPMPAMCWRRCARSARPRTCIWTSAPMR